MSFVFQLALIIVATKVAGDIAVRLGQPSVLGKLLVGIALGPALLNWVQPTDTLETFSTIGVLLLMFFAGLETDMKELNRNRTSSLAVAIGGIVLPFATGYLLGYAFDWGIPASLFLGITLSATSVSISIQTFKELGKSKSKESSTVIGAALVDDVLVVIFLSILLSLLTATDMSLLSVIGKKVTFFALAAVLVWKVVPWGMRLLAKLKISEAAISGGIVIALLFAVCAEAFGVAGIIGAFLAGIGVSRTSYKREIETKLEPIAYAIFVPVFFVSIGLSVSFHGMIDNLLFIVLLTLVAIGSKWIGSGLGARLTGFNARSSSIIGAGMISRGEVALIIAAIGLQVELLSKPHFSAVILAIVFTTVATPPILKALLHRKSH